jgi:hypothetical protein
MRIVRLKISRREKPLAEVESIDGKIDLKHSAEPPLRVSLESWLARGFHDWTGARAAARRRFTPPAHPEFLDRLGNYISEQTGLATSVETFERVEVPKSNAIMSPILVTASSVSREVRLESGGSQVGSPTVSVSP